MSKDSLICIILWISIQLFVEVNSQINPSLRMLHTATLVDEKLYILGGQNINRKDEDSGIIGKEYFYLNVSIPFDTKKLIWNDLTNINIIPAHVGAVSAKGGVNDDIVIYGGRGMPYTENLASVYMFDTKSNQWNIPQITGNSFAKRRSLLGFIDSSKKLYMFAGWVINGNHVNDMIILDTVNLSFREGSRLNAPSPRINYAGVILPSQNIVYMGGMMYDESALTLSEIYLYDTVNDKWSTRQTIGSIPSNRFGLSAVLGLDGQQIIIFGGTNGNEINSIESLYTLNLNTFEWRIPKVSGGNLPASRYYHRANVIGKYMVISFGSLFGGVLLSVGSFFLYNWNKNNRSRAIPTPGENDNQILMIASDRK
ncbi:11039_t:CDS:2 [Funneliformis caledonium]|uniref:11039_t:CDS:1 n=1 Tax=Funneliformis caledonium TaxID=1117310 RepID=A0A9N8YSB7_9GLOM|nr:11039_t:CDS:2 [Funneliformis caledonium]